MRALWIEIGGSFNRPQFLRSRPVRALWIEIYTGAFEVPESKSRPVRALWIEILNFLSSFMPRLRRGP